MTPADLPRPRGGTGGTHGESRLVPAEQLREVAASLLADGWRAALMAGHDDGDRLRVVTVWLKPGHPPYETATPVPRAHPTLPSLGDLDQALARFEREVHDSFGIIPEGHPFLRPLVRHRGWPEHWHPMRHDEPAAELTTSGPDFPFVPVEGDGVYEIPVGPVHAGLIEPGHFRFFVVGETILRMKARLWYLHRGVEKLCEGRPVDEGVALAERISGDTAVGHAVAYCQAVESALGITVSTAETATRALLLELERLHCHIADLGAMPMDVGLGIAATHAVRLRERLLRHNQHVTGHRLLRGGTGVGWAGLRHTPDLSLVRDVAAEASELSQLWVDQSVVADRFAGTGVLPRETAQALGCVGYVARASGLTGDARCDHPLLDLSALTGREMQPVVESAGDARARYDVRRRELPVSADLVAELAPLARVGEPQSYDATTGSGHGVGIVEAWRGRLVTRVEVHGGRLTRVRALDPSFLNWPALPLSLADTIVPDFPLVNKSFNQSYAGNDL